MATPAAGEGALSPRLLVPAEHLEGGVFDIDPLGTAGAKVLLCRPCERLLATPMLLAEDVALFAHIVALHHQAHRPAGGREGLAARLRLFHRALHLGFRALSNELASAAIALPPSPQSPDQLLLFVSRSARLAKVETAFLEGNFRAAQTRSEEVVRKLDLPESRYLAARLPEVVERIDAARANPEELADLAAEPKGLLEPSRLTASLAAAFKRGLHRIVAQSAEEQGAGTLVRGLPAGWYWRRAGDSERAVASLEACVREGRVLGIALTLLANIAHEDRDLTRSRDLYRRAFCEDSKNVPIEEITDSAVKLLTKDARDFQIDPPAEWVPMVGYVLHVFSLPSQPEGQGACRRFHAALLASRREAGDSRARREMKSLAPMLFERLRDEGRL
jgi:tetratricopeptide (TPR) repeat protein